MKILGELQVLVRIASPRIAGQPDVGEGGELTRYRLRAAIIKMAPRAILTASFMAFTKARLSYANEEEPAFVELPLVDDTRIKYTWHDAASILEAHTRLNTTGAMEIHHRSFSFQPADQVTGHQGEDLVRIATDSVINYQGKRIVGSYIASVQHKDGKPVAVQPRESRERSRPTGPGEPANPPPQEGIPAKRPKVSPKTCLLYTSPSPRDYAASRMPSSA